MADSEVSIANSALIKIGEDTIISFSDGDRKANAVAAQYPILRDRLLRKYRWNFAIRRVVLAADATAPSFGFEARFPLPSDCLRFLGIYDPSEPQGNYTSSIQAHKVEGRYVLADGSSLPVFYIARVDDVTQFDASFSEALACMLAEDLSYHLSTGPERRTQLKDAYEAAIREAKLTSAIETQPEVIVASDWLDSRAAYTGNFRPGPIWRG